MNRLAFSLIGSGVKTIFTRSITIDHTQCGGSDSVNFPVSIILSDLSLATTVNGGHVANNSGSDIIFSLSNTFGVLLNWEMVYYDPVSGIIEAYVSIPLVSHTTDTIFYIQYGNAAITTFQGGPYGSAWNSNYVAVYHLGNTSLSLADSTTTGNTLINSGSATLTTGKLGGAVSLNGTSTGALTRPLPSIPSGTASRSMSCWFKFGSNSPSVFISQGTAASTVGDRFGGVYITPNQLAIDDDGSNFATWIYDTNWHYFAATAPNNASCGNDIMYLDGSAPARTIISTNPLNNGFQEFKIGGVANYTSGFFFTGLVDEVRIRTDQVNSDFILTEYNSQNNPGNIGAAAFLKYGIEV